MYSEYEVIYRFNLKELEKMVNYRISIGWQPIGGLVKDGSAHYQTMGKVSPATVKAETVISPAVVVKPKNARVRKYDTPGRMFIHRGINGDETSFAREAARNLEYAFNWDSTAEGHDFWKKIYSRIVAISKRNFKTSPTSQE